MRRKGQGFSLGSDVLPFLISGFIAITILVFFITLIFRITNDVQTAQETRDAINYASALMGNEQLAYNEDGRISRGIFDKSKLDQLEKDGCNNLNLKYLESGLSVKDLDEDYQWSICSHKSAIQIPFPVSIRSGNEVHLGIMYASVLK